MVGGRQCMFGGFAGHLLNKLVHFHVCGDFTNILGSLLGRTCSGCGFRLKQPLQRRFKAQ